MEPVKRNFSSAEKLMAVEDVSSRNIEFYKFLTSSSDTLPTVLPEEVFKSWKKNPNETCTF